MPIIKTNANLTAYLTPQPWATDMNLLQGFCDGHVLAPVQETQLNPYPDAACGSKADMRCGSDVNGRPQYDSTTPSFGHPLEATPPSPPCSA